MVPVFLSVVGCTTYRLLRNLLAPASPKDKSFKEIVDTLKAHFEPKPLVIAERFHFHRRNQNSGESVAMYVAELRRLATHCAFEAYLEEALRDRLVCGLRSESTQKRLLSEADLTLARAVEIAQSMEAAHKNAQALKGPELPVRRLEKLPRERGEVERKARGQGGKKPCYRCGQRGHLPHECGFKEATCHKCKKRGHIAKVCRSA